MFGLTFIYGVGVPGLPPAEQTGSWAYAILPFVEQQVVYQDRSWVSPVSLYLCPSRSRPGTLPAVNDRFGSYVGGGWSWGRTDYAANAFAIANRPTCLRVADIKDGTSQTVLLGEKAVSPDNYGTGTWYWDEPFFTGGSGGTLRGFGTRPGEGLAVLPDKNDPALTFRYNWGSAHSTGAQFLFADGSVHLVPFGTAVATVRALLTPDGNEVIPDAF
jgi:prepilin-type processing-associated H-X9-DG protein